VRAPVTRILFDGTVDLVLRLLQVALAQMLDAELQVDLGRALRLRFGLVTLLLLAQLPRQMTRAARPIPIVVAARFTLSPPLR
jgi:hypothetical protein